MKIRVRVSAVQSVSAGILSAAERERAAGFRREADRAAYVGAHVLLRTELSRADPLVEPAQWELDPRRPGRVPGHRWRWSLSHTRGQVAVVISPGVACGIDTEAGDVSGWEAWGREVLSGAEGRWLSSLPAGVRDAGFRHLWTVKEALAKATDRGLGAWLRGVTVSLGAPITVSDEEGRLPFTVSLAAGAVPTAVAVAGESRGVEWVFAADPPAAGR